MYWLPTHELPEEKWLSPGELLAPFRYKCLPDHAAKPAVSILYLCCINHCPKTDVLINIIVYPNTEQTLCSIRIITCNARPSHHASRLYNMIEDQLKRFTGQFSDTVIPRQLLRDHLTQDISPQVLDQHSFYSGNRMSACQIAQQSLVFTCCGLAGHKMTMSVLDHHATPTQVPQAIRITVVFYSQHTVQQCIAPKHAVLDPKRPMLASH